MTKVTERRRWALLTEVTAVNRRLSGRYRGSHSINVLGECSGLAHWSMLGYSMVGHRHSMQRVCGQGGGTDPLSPYRRCLRLRTSCTNPDLTDWSVVTMVCIHPSRILGWVLTYQRDCVERGYSCISHWQLPAPSGCEWRPTANRPVTPTRPATAQTNISHNLVKEQLRTCGRNSTVNGDHLDYLRDSPTGCGGTPVVARRAPGVDP